MFEQWENRLLLIVILILFAGSVSFWFVMTTVRGSEDLAKYNETEKTEYTKIFATRNKDYKDQTQEDSIQIILEFSEDNSKDANVAVMNYLSNVNGKLLSINGKSVSKDTLNPVVGGMYGKKSGLGLGVGLTPGTDVKTKNVYLVLVPKDAKFSDDLQERMDRYLKYK
ncbi:hypothetical protein [Peptoniphilus harei]|uniref:Uncharacterized protein n=1 Tax=Peptoniphilus harei TaxID=54005 RepID=A0A943SS97_9FIRM|nr:hypothetical protein [Peptoniphilus harei]MBS6535857.1 hypothetical protein [Peptoniphilus harei]